MAQAKEDVETTAVECVVDGCDGSKLCHAMGAVHSYMWGGAVASIIPVPGLDMAAVAAVELKMVHSLSKIYGIPFRQDLGKSIIASLIGGVGSISLARGGLVSLAKSVPVVGGILGALVMPGMAAALTYAVGRVFIQHFESGGTFLDMDPQEVKTYFAQQFEEGKLVVKKATGGAK
ncbi:MAG: YcjF family protein [Planctomycetota bacterium]